MKNTSLTFIFLFIFTLSVFAQHTVSGVVMAEGESDPVIGANVLVKGTNNGTITDFDGAFSLSAAEGDILVISYLGYKTAEVKASSSPMNITLKSDNVMLDEVVAVGYGAMRKSDLTGAITSVNKDDLTRAPVSGVDQALQGRAAGVTVTSNSGQPGEGATIRIRGIGSAIGGNDPLYVVDGVITGDISFLSPQDIQSMEILKDASATAIYGSRGANGVILVTTRSGSEGKKAVVNFDAYWGMQNRWKKLGLLSAQDQALTKLRIDAMKNGAGQLKDFVNDGFNAWMEAWNLGSSHYFPVVQSAAHPDGFDYSTSSTDWQDEVFRKNAFIHNYNLSVDGGSEKGHYAFSANYFSQDGTIIGSEYHRLSLRLNSDFNVRKWLTLGEHLSFVYSDGKRAMNNNSSPGASVISAALAMAPWDPAHYADGCTNNKGDDLSGRIAASSNFKNVTNPFTMVEESFPENKKERVVGDIYLEIKPVEGLTIRPSMSVDFTLNRDRNFKNAYDYSGYDRATKNFISSSMGRYCSLFEEVTATYARKINKHNFSVMVGQTWQEDNNYIMSGSGAEILNPVSSNWYLSNATSDITESHDEVYRVRRISFLGRAFYSYDDRYMVTVNFRADASSRFTKNPWGFFPSASLAWRMSQEPWLRDQAWLDNLKLRAGWGRVGNDGISGSAFQQTVTTSTKVFTDYPLGGYPQTIVPGAAVLSLINQDGKWETNEQWDAGVDFSFWNGMLNGSLDYFCRNTLDALMYVNAPAHVGNMHSPIKNVGNIRNEGVEIVLNHDNTVGKVKYHIGGNISFIKNQLTKNNGGSPLWGDRTKTDVGMALNSFWGYEYDGVYQSDKEALEHLFSYTDKTIGAHAGDAKYVDQNNDGMIDGNDQVCIGNPFPKMTYGLSLGAEFYGVDVQLFFQGVYGNQIYNALRERTEGAGDECTLADYMAKDVWIGYTDLVRISMEQKGLDWLAYENRTGTIPNPVGSSMNKANSSRFVEDGSYFRLKNLQIGYTFPKKWTNRFLCQRLRLYFTASNLFTITHYSGYDPEVGAGVDYGNYPQSRTFTFGLNATF